MRIATSSLNPNQRVVSVASIMPASGLCDTICQPIARAVSIARREGAIRREWQNDRSEVAICVLVHARRALIDPLRITSSQRYDAGETRRIGQVRRHVVDRRRSSHRKNLPQRKQEKRQADHHQQRGHPTSLARHRSTPPRHAACDGSHQPDAAGTRKQKQTHTEIPPGPTCSRSRTRHQQNPYCRQTHGDRSHLLTPADSFKTTVSSGRSRSAG